MAVVTPDWPLQQLGGDNDGLTVNFDQNLVSRNLRDTRLDKHEIADCYAIYHATLASFSASGSAPHMPRVRR